MVVEITIFIFTLNYFELLKTARLSSHSLGYFNSQK